MLKANLPISLYVHYPWCVRKCPYCDFNSVAREGGNADKPYLKALLSDFREQTKLLDNRKLCSVYFGGGTPSLADPSFIKSLIDAFEPYLDVNAEISLEVNPGTADLEKFRALRASGVNRLSIGVQSFDDRMLKNLGRIHDAAAAKKAVESALSAGFDNINVDIMHGLPGQNVKQALLDLKEAELLGANHLSWYELTIEDDTYFGNHPPKLPGEDTLFTIEQEGFALLESLGYKRYEVSAFTKNAPCRHNLNYWYFYDYLGIGAGAHGKVSSDGKVMRRACPNNPKLYINGDYGTYQNVSLKDLPFEFMLNRLRLFNPIAFDEFEQSTNLGIDVVKTELNQACSLGLMTVNEGGRSFELTATGRLMLNEVLELFL